jgi:hypothetical protein
VHRPTTAERDNPAAFASAVQDDIAAALGLPLEAVSKTCDNRAAYAYWQAGRAGATVAPAPAEP